MGSRIAAIASHLPEGILDNDTLANLYPGWTADKIFEKTGIRCRHVASQGECASDLAEKAARKLFDSNRIDPASIDFLLLATQSPDHFIPTTACILHGKLGLARTAGALDFNLGCSACIYGLALAKGLVAAGLSRNCLLLTAETYTKYIHPMDKSVRTIFGDAAAATLVTASPEDSLGQFVLGSDGSGWNKLIVPAGAFRIPASQAPAEIKTDESGNMRGSCNLFMDGPEIFNFTIDTVPNNVRACLEANGDTMDTIDLFVFHQANRYMLDFLRKSIGIPKDKFYVNLAETGNTVSASIPLALDLAQADGRLKDGMRVMLVGFGVGLSWGAVVLTWNPGIRG